MTTKDLKQIGKNIRIAREAKGMTQAEVARGCRITTNYYARIVKVPFFSTGLMVVKLRGVLAFFRA